MPTPYDQAKFGKPQEGLEMLNAEYLVGPGDRVRFTFFLGAGVQKGEYKLQAGDILLLEIHGHEHLNRNLTIRTDGRVTLPMAGEMEAADRTTRDLADAIRERLSGVIQTPKITLSVVRFNSYYRALQDALANQTGTRQSLDLTVDMNGNLRVPLCPRMQVAGHTTQWIEEEIKKHFNKIGSGVEVMLEILNARSYLVYVLGEVNRPGLIEMRAPTTAIQALAMAGGYKDTAGLSSVVLVRPDKQRKPQARLLDLEKALSEGDISQDARLQRFDIVYVPPSAIAKLNQAVLFGIRNMLPVQTNVGFTYIWGQTDDFQPF